MPDPSAATGLIGPNAILQLLPVLDRWGGPERRDALLTQAGIMAVPDGSCMIPEETAARLHHALRVTDPDNAPALARDAGTGTADYILAHRIPGLAQRVLKRAPAPIAARLLAKAIAKHAWTFAGSGRFTVRSPWCFEIEDNPLVRAERGATCLCHWHAAVFTRLYATLVAPDVRFRETDCAALGRGHRCLFEATRRA
ncbi:bacteriochlorophyll 4-vinyl reductase [Cognatishimia sp. F0-27]|uniref:bacteriochlorophyll 4-vinyl reductase n=1 Tax=Cognatishimia sp. F0-27 TaxID=2816855 RepID=UPI001D0C5BFB|nr:bacteriochlorophyll 4-vinyl reductase [Cognatishimia sp. F0-27]MCC1491489.1 bacteriochlorophyll 4-vinyl reductase [Cognatishimia sp. F0-27]